MNRPEGASIFDAVADVLQRASRPQEASLESLESLAADHPSTDYHSVAKALVAEAFANGLIQDLGFVAEQQPVSEGATAEHVSFNTISLGFVLKADVKHKLVLEARNLQEIRAREDLPDCFRSMFPRVFSVKSDGPPYAYLMEQVIDCDSYSALLFSKGIEKYHALRVADAVLDALFSAYRTTVDPLLAASIAHTYLGRIKERLKLAADLDPQFRRVIELPLNLNGTMFDPPAAYIAKIESSLDHYATRFTTFVHGDCHPENILVKRNPADGEPGIHFIDPKEWRAGDYLFDMGKLRHFIEVTGPAEVVATPPKAEIHIGTKDARLSYQLVPSDTASAVSDHIAQRVRGLAAELEDQNWERRMRLSMAANLLGLPAGRLSPTKAGQLERKNSALIMYGEGLQHLAACCV